MFIRGRPENLPFNPRKLSLEVMTIDPKNNKHIIADEGKYFRRKADGTMYGDEIYLGNTYYIGGILQNPPHADVPEDFEEVDRPKDETPEDQPQAEQQ